MPVAEPDTAVDDEVGNVDAEVGVGRLDDSGPTM